MMVSHVIDMMNIVGWFLMLGYAVSQCAVGVPKFLSHYTVDHIENFYIANYGYYHKRLHTNLIFNATDAFTQVDKK